MLRGRSTPRCDASCAISEGPDWVVLDAVPCVLAKLRGSFRWHIVVKCPTDHDVSRALLPLFRARKADARVNVAVDVDPEDLL